MKTKMLLTGVAISLAMTACVANTIQSGAVISCPSAMLCTGLKITDCTLQGNNADRWRLIQVQKQPFYGNVYRVLYTIARPNGAGFYANCIYGNDSDPNSPDKTVYQSLPGDSYQLVTGTGWTADGIGERGTHVCYYRGGNSCGLEMPTLSK